jgi:hypothetical protein
VGRCWRAVALRHVRLIQRKRSGFHLRPCDGTLRS